MSSDEMKQSEVVMLLMTVLNLGERQIRRRVIAAIPADWTKTRYGNGFVELRRVEITRSNIRIERRPITP